MIKLLNIAHQVLEEQQTNEAGLGKKIVKGALATMLGLGAANYYGQKVPVEKVANVKKTVSSYFSYIDLSTDEGIKQYAEICQKFIDSRPSNLLGITGDMMAKAAAAVFDTGYVPPELALAQLATEGGFANKPNARPIRTQNPYNIGNVDDGTNQSFSNVSDAIKAYYKLMAKDYLSSTKSPDDLLKNFVNKAGNRYASAKNYESTLKKFVSKANNIAKEVTK